MSGILKESFQTADVPRTSRPAKILCIDDDPAIPSSIAIRLRGFEVEVIPAYHGMHGFAIASHEDPDVIITDLRMPMGEGAFVLESLKQNAQTAHIPVIVLTGQRGSDLPGRMHHLGAERFFQKPVAFTKLLEELARHIPLRVRDPSAFQD